MKKIFYISYKQTDKLNLKHSWLIHETKYSLEELHNKWYITIDLNTGKISAPAFCETFVAAPDAESFELNALDYHQTDILIKEGYY